MKKFIDNDEDHNRVLYDLDLIDDTDDWKLFCEKQREQSKIEPSYEVWLKYVKHSTNK